MFCTNCGAQIEDGSVFCTSCGAKQNGETQPVVNTPVATPYVPDTYVHQQQPAMQNPINTNWANSYFDGGLLGLIGVNLAVAFVSFITIGLAWPALWCFRLRWVYKHTVVGGYRLKFNGKGGQLFGKYLLWVLLTIVTATIYAWWLPIKYKKWEVSHVEIDSMIPNNRY